MTLQIRAAIWLAGVLGVLWFGNHLRGMYDAAALDAKVNAAIEAAQKQCAENQHKSEEVNNGLQKDLDSIQRKLAAQRLQPHPVCIPTDSKQPDATGRTEHAGGNGKGGISTDWLFIYAARCEDYRTVVLGCQKFLKLERGL